MRLPDHVGVHPARPFPVHRRRRRRGSAAKSLEGNLNVCDGNRSAEPLLRPRPLETGRRRWGRQLKKTPNFFCLISHQCLIFKIKFLLLNFLLKLFLNTHGSPYFRSWHSRTKKQLKRKILRENTIFLASFRLKLSILVLTNQNFIYC